MITALIIIALCLICLSLVCSLVVDYLAYTRERDERRRKRGKTQ